MVSVTPDYQSRKALRWPLALAAGLFAVEILLIGLVFKHAIPFECRANWPADVCILASGTLVSVYSVLGAATLLVMLRPAPFRALVAHSGEALWPLILNLAGFALVMAPVAFLRDGVGTAVLAPTLASWTIGFALLLAGLGRYIAPGSGWRAFIAETWSQLLPVGIVGLSAPLLATMIRPFWHLETLASATFSATAWNLNALGYDAFIDAETRVIGVYPFFVNVAPVCSGIEGIALVTLFVTLYLALFRKDLRFPRALLLYPVGICLSALFNLVRITVLLVIGIEGNPELAVGGFHSHAGWAMFTIVALGIVLLAQTVPALQKAPGAAVSGAPAPARAPLPRFREDPAAAAILPFAIFMLSAQFASVFAQNPGVVYPLRVLAMAGALLVFWRVLRALPWRLDPLACALGSAIAVMWCAIPVAPSDGPPPYGALSGALLIGWFALRAIGTAICVPIIEELFFRQYLEKRLRLGTGFAWVVFAALIGATLFALLHARWAEAFVASLVFSYLAYRRGNITDAIVAHGVANALIFGWALAVGRLDII